MRRTSRRTLSFALIQVLMLLGGCTISFFGRADCGAEVEADYGARYEESGEGRQTTGIRHGDFDPD